MDVNVKLDITHSYTSDLEIHLMSPDGNSIMLVRGRGGSGDNFEDTTFDDSAPNVIAAGTPPFKNQFRPEEPLATFHGAAQNGNWSLEVRDRASQDGGSLNAWELEIITDEASVNPGPFIFRNQNQHAISASGRNHIESQIHVHGLDGVVIDELCVSLDIDHTFTRDLKISLVSPGGIEVVLVENEGGDGNNFRETNFDDNASQMIAGASAPFTGTFQSEESLSQFRGNVANGIWVLKIADQANLDGGALNHWALSIKSNVSPNPIRPYRIKVIFTGGLSPSQQDIFQLAADRWAEIISADLPPIAEDNGPVDLIIHASGENIDGTGGVLGSAGPTRIRSSNSRPVEGMMRFDSADLTQMENSGELQDVIIHEMGHVLGIGTLWDHLGLIVDAGNNNPEFVGENAMREYAALKGLSNPTRVPVANTGGQGTAGGHWRETVFDTELMTGYDDPGRNALSRLTVASLQDLGYQVDYDKADPYILPFGLLSALEVSVKAPHRCQVLVPDFEIVPDDEIL